MPCIERTVASTDRRDGHTGRHRVARLMRLESLRGKAARRFRFIATRRSDFPAAPNLVLRNFRADAPNRLWVVEGLRQNREPVAVERGRPRPSVRLRPGLEELPGFRERDVLRFLPDPHLAAEDPVHR